MEKNFNQRIILLFKEMSFLIAYPIILLLIGVSIHLYNILLIIAGKTDPAIWEAWVHVFMLSFNITILAGIIYCKRGFYLIFIIGLCLMIFTWITNSIIIKYINISTLLGIISCIIGIPVMIFLYRKLKYPAHQ
jgi:hypothetical protein